jgi:formylglycine-generating enzyme required for sulfatase activity
VYTFPHRSFQEYLTAAYLRREEETLFKQYPDCEEFGDWQEVAAWLGTTDPDRWREVIVLAGGIKAHKEPGPVWQLLDYLFPQPVDALGRADAWGLRLAGEILAENLRHDGLNRKQAVIFKQIRQGLPAALCTPHLKAVERVAVGNYLAAIGDPRQEVMEVDAMLFCHVPAGAFWMGKGAADKDDEKFRPETPAGEYDLDYAYWMAKYPVTVAQFRQFVEDSKHKPVSGNRWQGKDNDPVVYVTWHDAMAFCQWLTERWSLPGWRVTLPDEPEWEKAARGGLQVPMEPVIESVKKIPPSPPFAKGGMEENPLPQRRYPWGYEDDDEHLNYSMKVGQVSTQGVYPAGQSVYGCDDLSGNVWEWTRSQYADYPYPAVGTEEWKQREGGNDDSTRNASRVLRGGAFNYNPRNVRSAVRIGGDPDGGGNNIGFRVCLSPLL